MRCQVGRLHAPFRNFIPYHSQLPPSTFCLFKQPSFSISTPKTSLVPICEKDTLEQRCPSLRKEMVADIVTLVSRKGRELQRYSSTGGRIVVGCIPYRVNGKISCSDDIDKAMEVLVISSQKGNGMMFPKGGWELDETAKAAASREALEEAGVQGKIERRLGKWSYMSKSHNIFYEGILYPLNVTDEMPHWPEMQLRKRRWVAVAEAKEGCPHQWMIEALDRLLNRLKRSSNKR